MSDNTLDASRVRAFVRNVRAEYDEATVIGKHWIVNSRNAKPSDRLPFVQIGVHYLADRVIFTDPSYHPDIIGTGRSVAIGEERYLVKTVLDCEGVKVVQKEKLSSKTVLDALRKMRADFHPTAVFIPLAFHNALYMSQIPGVRLVHYPKAHGLRGPLLDYGLPERPRVFWSNKYISFRSIIFVDQDLGEWVAKTEDTHRLVVDIKPAKDETKVDLTVKTVAYLDISNPAAVMLLDVPAPTESNLRTSSR